MIPFKFGSREWVVTLTKIVLGESGRDRGQTVLVGLTPGRFSLSIQDAYDEGVLFEMAALSRP